MTGEAKEKLKNAAHYAATEFGNSDYNPKPHAHHHHLYKAPGRLGHPQMELEDEPRAHASLREQLLQIGMGKHVPPKKLANLNENSSLDEIAELVAEFEDGIMALYSAIPLETPEDAKEPKIEMTKETIKGGDGQDMIVYIYRPEGQKEALPGVIYTHGGGMVINETFNPVHDRWCKSIATYGCVVAMIDFRNAYTKQGYNHFPKPLNDCVAGVKWVIANKETLRMRNVVVQGESGGANLALAVALTANRENWVKDIAGIYAIVPYISGVYGWSEERLLKELPSLVECNGYFLERPATAFLAHFYTPTDEDQTNPLAWPYFATVEDMKGLPPHILVMDELDMLRDEGISYARRLVKAGVEARGSVNLGIVHGSSLIFRSSARAHNNGAAREIAAFARSL